MKTRTLRLVVPCLLGPWPTELLSNSEIPQVSALTKLLSRSCRENTTSEDSFETVLCRLFNIPSNGSDLPIAALSYPVDSGQESQGLYLRADPVHIRPEMYQLILHATGPIESFEAKALCDAFNEAFSATGISLEVPVPNRWYLHCPQAPALSTVALSQALGQDITPLLPSGSDAQQWHALLTECQMLFHEHPVNQAREAKGLPSINSVWLWGSGTLLAPQKPDFAEVYGNDVLTRGLARWAGLAVEPVPDNAEDWLDISDTSTLIVLPTLPSYDFAAWSEAIRELDSEWFTSLLNALRCKRIKQLCLEPCDGRRFIVTRHDLRRFWPRSKTLEHWLSA